MEKEFCWTLEDVARQNPIDPEEKAKWFWFEKGTHASANLVQVRGGGVIPSHIHKEHDEFIYIVCGEAEFKVEGVARKAKAGDFIIASAEIVHSVKILSDTALVLSIYAPFHPPDPNYDRIPVQG